MNIESQWEATGYVIKYPKLNTLFNILVTEHEARMFDYSEQMSKYGKIAELPYMTKKNFNNKGNSNKELYGPIGKDINTLKKRILDLPKEEQDSLLDYIESCIESYDYDMFMRLRHIVYASWKRFQPREPECIPGCPISRKSRKSKSRKSKSRKSRR